MNGDNTRRNSYQPKILTAPNDVAMLWMGCPITQASSGAAPEYVQ